MGLQGLAPAKINLFLHVAGPGSDGFHALSSLMVFADVGDQITVTEADSLGLKVYGTCAAGLDGEGDNLVLRAARALMARARRPLAPLGLALDKALPVAAGLGGGSSDAGTTLRLLREAWRLDLPDAELEAVATALGSDGAACLWARPVLAEGRGERLSPAPEMPGLDAVLVNPGVSVSTAKVYGLYDRGGRFSDPVPPPLPANFESVQELAAWLTTTRNDLQAPAIELAPVIGDVIATLADEPEALFARMSGSGATCFALCGSDLEAQALADRVGQMRPDWWVQPCRLGGPWG